MYRLLPFAAASILLFTPAKAAPLYEDDFKSAKYGHVPDGWQDLLAVRPSRNWIVDGNGFVRFVLKPLSGSSTEPRSGAGLLVYVGYTADVKPAHALTDARLVAGFEKTEDDSVSFGIAGRVIDRNNFYLARFSGADRLELIKVKDGREQPLDFAKPVIDVASRTTGMATLQRYREGRHWQLSFTLEGERLTAVVDDGAGHEQARISAIDGEFKRGQPGLCCTRFAAASSFSVEALRPVEAKADAARLAKRNAVIAAREPTYPVVRPYWRTEELDTPREKLAAEYDVVIAGAGTGGWAAAVQAARMGARVLLLEETDWIGGQMSCAGVTTMDEDSVWMKFPVRERGIYREFHESMVAHYQTIDKDPLVAYYGYPEQHEGGYEPRVARAVLYGFIEEARERKATLDVSLQSHVVSVRKSGDTVTGVTVAFGDGSRKEVACKVLMDATEYGDVIPLTGARYRVGNSTSDKVDPAALVQDHTWTAVVREYLGGVPEHLQIKSPPPGYEEGAARRYRKFTNDGLMLWGAAGKGIKGSRHWRVYFAWRGMVDSESLLTGDRSAARHTQCGFNGGNDYPVTAATIEDRAQRLRDEREGIYKTLGTLYYFQHELGLNWALAEDEDYATAYNEAKMRALDLRPDLVDIAVHLPQQPYVRECRRIMGVQTLTAKDLGRFEQAKHVSTSVAMGDYFMDLDHGRTAHAVEADLDAGEAPKGGGPFQVPFEVFIPEKVDGFIPAEKNISQSRLANGATRLQPITMLTGQAAGAIAALAVKQDVQPRAVHPLQVQRALLDAGSTLIQRWYADVPWGTEMWRATQLLSLHKIMDRPGEIDRENAVALASRATWGVNEALKYEEMTTALMALLRYFNSEKLLDDPPGVAQASVSQEHLVTNLHAIDPRWARSAREFKFADPLRITRGEFALLAASVLSPSSKTD
jgi:hypothetical protein